MLQRTKTWLRDEEVRGGVTTLYSPLERRQTTDSKASSFSSRFMLCKSEENLNIVWARGPNPPLSISAWPTLTPLEKVSVLSDRRYLIDNRNIYKTQHMARTIQLPIIGSYLPPERISVQILLACSISSQWRQKFGLSYLKIVKKFNFSSSYSEFGL